MADDTLTDTLIRSTTAYEVLDIIKEIVLDDPLRVDMSNWLQVYEISDENPVLYGSVKESWIPSCGMVGCIGGWTERLIGSCHRLGLNKEQEQELFYPSVLNGDLMNWESYQEIEGYTHPQTSEHARIVADHIIRFQENNFQQLQATHIKREDVRGTKWETTSLTGARE